MNNIVHVYHVRDAYDHAIGYSVNNTYNNLADETIKELINKQERYLKAADIGGYWVQVISYEIGGETTIVDHIKTTPQKTRIELNVKAKRGPRKSMDQAMTELQINLAAPPVIANNLWAHVAAHNGVVDAAGQADIVAAPQPVGEWI